MKRFWILLINLYQAYISPHKGFRCAHAHVHGGASCSEAVKAIIHNHGLLQGWSLIKSRFGECAAASESLNRKGRNKKRRHKKDKEKWYNYCDCSGCADIYSCFPGKGRSGTGASDCGCDGPFDCSL